MATINEVTQIIAAADICGHVPLISGLHGLGKSESVSQYTKDEDMHFEPLILSLMDTGDMIGLPTEKTIGGMSSTVWAAPSWYSNVVNAAWPDMLEIDQLVFNDKSLSAKVLFIADECALIARERLNTIYCSFYSLPNDRLQILRQDNVTYKKSRRACIFLDEFNRAHTDILNASLQLILDHRLHTHELPIVRGQETLIVAAINPADGNYAVQEFDPALLDRFVTCEVTADFKSWLKWAKSNKVNQIIIDFLMDNQNKFHSSPEDGSKGTSPRSWTRLGTYLDRIDSTPKAVMTHYLIGTLGSAIASSFLMFYNNYGDGFTSKDVELLIKKTIKNAKPDENSPEELSMCLVDVMDKLEAVRKLEFAETFINTYIDKTPKAALPLLVFLYALPIESLSAVLKNLQTDNLVNYGKLAALDKVINGKKLFIKLVSNLKTSS
jgi:MoxR-like ATPase